MKAARKLRRRTLARATAQFIVIAKKRDANPAPDGAHSPGDTAHLGENYFLRRDFFATTRFRAAADLSIAKSSILRPCLSRAASHRGRAPRPAQVSPPGPRYFGGTLRPFIAERRPHAPRELAPPSAPSRESCFSSSLRFSPSLLSISPRSVSSASTSIPLRLIAGINGLPSISRGIAFDRTIQPKRKHAKVASKLCIPNLLAAWCGKTCNIDRYKVERRTFQSTIIPSLDGPDKVWTSRSSSRWRSARAASTRPDRAATANTRRSTRASFRSCCSPSWTAKPS